MKLPLTLLACLLSAAFFAQPASRDARVDLRDLELTVEQLGPAPLPLQPIRFRASLRNVSPKQLGPLPHLGGYMRIFGGPRNEELAFGLLLPQDVMGNPPARRFVDLDLATPLFLSPGEQTVRSRACAADWRGTHEGLDRAKAVFVAPGEYSLKWGYEIRVTETPQGLRRETISKEITFRVLQPVGDDLAVYNLLEKDAELAGAMMSPIHVPPEHVKGQLLLLVARYPNSSYADYARFALARNWDRGIPGIPYQECYREAARYLEQVASRPFAYQPYALIYLSRIYHKLKQPEKEQQIKDILLRDHPDAFEVIEEYAHRWFKEDWRAKLEHRRKELQARLPSPERDEELQLVEGAIRGGLSDPGHDYRAKVQAETWLAFRKRWPGGVEPLRVMPQSSEPEVLPSPRPSREATPVPPAEDAVEPAASSAAGFWHTVAPWLFIGAAALLAALAVWYLRGRTAA